MEILSFLPGSLVSYLLFHITSHPNSKVRQRLPQIKVSRFQICPTIQIDVKGRIIHLHHWFNFLVLLAISIPAHWVILDLVFAKGFLVGGIVQGIRLPNARKMIYRHGTVR